MFLVSFGFFLYDIFFLFCIVYVFVIFLILKDEMVDVSNLLEWFIMGVGLREVIYKIFVGFLFKGVVYFYIMYL